MDTVLQLLKIDLGITHSARDTLFTSLLGSAQKQLNEKGIVLVLTNVDDQMLLSDYAAWMYRKRMEDVGLSKNLELRIRNRIVRGRAEFVE